MKIDNTFKANYEIELQLYPVEEDIYYIPSKKEATTGSNVIIEVKLFNKQLNVCIASGTFADEKYEVFTSPNPNSFFFISNGEGYYISLKENLKWENIRSIPIISKIILKNLNMVLFYDYMYICAYNQNGFKWKTSRLGFDDFEITSINENRNFIEGKYWDIRSNSEEIFKIDLHSGQHIEGTNFVEF